MPANYTFTSGDAGQHTFSATLKTAGSQSLKATDTTTGSITGSQTGIVVSAAATSSFAVTGFPSPTTAGVAGNFTVTAKDPYNNATSYTGKVHLTSSDPQAVLPADYTFNIREAGRHTFSNTTLKTAGSQSLTATDTVTSSITGSQTGITVNPAAASHFAVSAPASTTAGSAFSFTVTIQDPFNNTATGYTGTVHFMSSDGQAVLPADSTLSNGTGSFSATLKTEGNQTITATDTASSSITGMSNSIRVNAAAATHFAVSAPASATAGTAFSFTVTAQDAFNNTATGYTGAVHFSSAG